MSGYTGDQALRRGVEQRAVRFLQKPFDMAALAREVWEALEVVERWVGPATGADESEG